MGLIVAVSCPLFPCSAQNTNDTPTASSVVASSNDSSAPGQIRLRQSVAGVVKLLNAGFSNDVVVAYVNSLGSPFNLTANEIIQIKDQGVPLPVITAMLNHDAALQNSIPAAPPSYNNSQTPAATNDNAVVYQAQSNPQPQVVGQAPSTVQVEYVGASPGPDYYWYPGYWGWNNGWVWVGGYWGPRVGYRGWVGYHGGYTYHVGAGFDRRDRFR